ncbi:hypothetical protein BC835DRAFT_949120 [Cytidiella melzeri]|nr:hypothetical protein BC835DRAFT_949120 [Cytidiella melzeri]
MTLLTWVNREKSCDLSQTVYVILWMTLRYAVDPAAVKLPVHDMARDRVSIRTHYCVIVLITHAVYYEHNDTTEFRWETKVCISVTYILLAKKQCSGRCIISGGAFLDVHPIRLQFLKRVQDADQKRPRDTQATTGLMPGSQPLRGWQAGTLEVAQI